MRASRRPSVLLPFFLGLLIPLIAALFLATILRTPSAALARKAAQEGAADPASPDVACSGGPVIDGITLDECVVQNFSVGGDSVSITVWYTQNTVTATRTLGDGSTIVLSHWINDDSEAQEIADWGQEAWELYYDIFGRHPYTTGCSNNIDVRLEDLAKGAGVAYWASSGSCRIGIDAPVVRAGNAQRTTYHEFQHYLQYAYDSGCYNDIKSNYDDNAEFVEGYADLAEDSVDATVDTAASGGRVSGYDPTKSLYDEGYLNVFTKYFVEHVGQLYTTADPHHGWDAVEAHYDECDNQNSLYVLDTVVPAQTAGALSKESLFLNFFAANWAKDWADDATQPNLVYYDDDGNWYGDVALQQNVNLSTSQSWNGESTPDDWAGQYYQVTPQTGCDYVTVDVDGETGAVLGINLMAADTVAATKVTRSAWIGEDFTRTFGGDGVHDRVVAAVNAFNDTYNYDVSFTCVTPTVELLEPKPRPNSTLVGEPASPIAYLTRFKVTDGGSPVRGLPETSFSADAEGDAISFVANTFQEVGEEYWAVMTPPAKSAGTTYVDMEVCLDGSTCDSNSEALLYVPPGNSDLAMVFDASGSMTTVDVVGEGSRLENAQKAGRVMADLLQDGDRIRVSDFSAQNVPVGCGLPGGDGNCPLDINVYLSRMDVSVPTTIGQVRNAIDMVNARDWTPIGGALVDAKDGLLAAPAGDNPKHIILLSDGEENVNPLYADVRSELMDSGVIIDTIGFSGDAPEPLLSQIAGDTGGTYRFVSTTPGTSSQSNLQQQESTVAELQALGLTAQQVESISAANLYLPGPLALDEVYDYLDTKAQGAARILNAFNSNLASGEWYTGTTNVDDSATTLRLVVAGKHADQAVNEPPGCGEIYRLTQVQTPTLNGTSKWISINPQGNIGSWDVRNSAYDDVAIISNPEPGEWIVRTQYSYGLCAQDPEPQAPQQSAYPVMINASVQSQYHLQGRFLPPLGHGNTGVAGQPAHVVTTLLDRDGTIPGATVIAIVGRPDGGLAASYVLDDGEHNDGGDGDGIYGFTYPLTDIGGTYTVRVFAFFPDPAGSGMSVRRDWIGSFWIDGPEPQEPDRKDQDRDGMPDPWEERCDLDPTIDDAKLDSDDDGLININEWQNGTLPCDPDTDDGGERDGSEVNNGRNPRLPDDDLVPPLRFVDVRGLNGQILVYWTRPFSYTNMVAQVHTGGQLLTTVNMGQEGTYYIGDLQNGQSYTATIYGQNGNALGDYAGPFVVMPREDPVRPQGSVLINYDAPETGFRQVTLNLDALDEATAGPYATPPEEQLVPNHGETPHASGVSEMRIANDLSEFADPNAGWEPFAREKPWELANCDNDLCIVYAQFRDDAGNVSVTVSDEILFTGSELFLPLLNKAP